jgi:hypothetical protein
MQRTLVLGLVCSTSGVAARIGIGVNWPTRSRSTCLFGRGDKTGLYLQLSWFEKALT